MKKIICILCLIAMLIPFAAVLSSAEEFVYRTDVGATNLKGEQLEKWANFYFTDQTPYTEKSDYTFAFVGDTQYVTYADFRDGTNNLETAYKWLADNAEAKNVEHVFVLGDITNDSCRNDPTISAKSLLKYRTGEEEWKIAKRAISQLDGKVEYSLVRGNHDDFNFTSFLGTEQYRSMFEGFYHTDSGNTENSICNSYKLFEVHDDKYLFITLDFNSTYDVIDWANEIVEKYPDRRVIITVHAYMYPSRTLIADPDDRGSYVTFNGVDGKYIWDNLASKHENIFMVACGHVTDENPIYGFRTAKNGNKVLELLVDPSTIDKYKAYSGMICFMNVYDGGERITLEWYSPIIGGYKKTGFKEFTMNLSDTPIFNVDFDANGHESTPEPIKLSKGEKLTEPTPLTKEGYTFGGWFTDKELTKAWNFAENTVTDDITLYAKWEEIPKETEPVTESQATQTEAASEKTTDTTATQSGCAGTVSLGALVAIAPALTIALTRKKKKTETRKQRRQQ